MEIQLLLQTLDTNVRASLAEFESLRSDPHSEFGFPRRPPIIALDKKPPIPSIPGQKNIDTRPESVTLRADKVTVFVHCQIHKIGEVDTVGEKFYAELQVNSRWREPALDGVRRNVVEVFDRWNNHWNPELQVMNAFSGVKESVVYNLSFDSDGRAMVQEQRLLSGSFAESLELGDYPFDTQELTVKLLSSRDEAELSLVKDPDKESTINTETFAHRQLWTLSKTVRVWSTAVSDAFSSSTKKQPLLCMCCVVKRKATFFIWNVILVMICICSMIFTTFTIDVGVHLVSGRLSLSFFILLSNVTFKFSVSSTIPKVPYLTYLDRYIILSMVLLCVVCIWHAVAILFNAANARFIDRVALGVLLSCYVLFNIVFAIRSRYKSRKRREL